MMALSKQIKNAFSSSDTLICRSMLEAQIQSPQKLLMQFVPIWQVVACMNIP